MVSTDPSFCPLHTSSLIPIALCNPGPVDACPPGKNQNSSRLSEFGDRRWPCKPGHVQLHWGFTLARTVWVHLGDIHFSQDHCHPLSYIQQPYNGLSRSKRL